MKAIIVLIVLLVVVMFWYKGETTEPDVNNPTNPIVVLETNKGDIELELFADKTLKTVQNFLTLAERNFYNDTLFHRVIKNFMIQGGDPNTRAGDPSTFGTGGSGYQFADEFVTGLSNVKGTISMANSGPNTNGSQFFINVADNTFLDGKHTVFGKVTKGLDVVMAISKIPTNENDLPLVPVRIDRIIIEK